MRKIAFLIALIIGCLMVPTHTSSAQSWPTRPINLIVPWSAGGGTDAIARQVAHQLEGKLGVPVNVVNRTGGGGLVGHTAIATAPADGYTLGLVTFEITTYRWLGLSNLGVESYTPIAQINFDPAGIQVVADAPYETAMDLIESIRQNPHRYRASTSGGQGTGWQLAFAGLLQRLGIDPLTVIWTPSEGAAPALRDMVAGAIEIVACSVAEAAPLINANRVKSLAVLANQRVPAFPDVPTAEEATGIAWEAGTWRGIVAPAGLPGEIARKLEEALREIVESEEYQNFMMNAGFGVLWRGSQDFASYWAQAEQDTGEILKSLDLAN